MLSDGHLQYADLYMMGYYYYTTVLLYLEFQRKKNKSYLPYISQTAYF